MRFPLDPDRFEYFINKYNLVELNPRYASVVPNLRHGYTFGISPLPPTSASFIPPNRVRNEKEAAVLVANAKKLKDEGKAYGGFPQKDVEEIAGPLQASAMTPIPKAPLPGKPERWRTIEDFSAPYQPDGSSSPLAVNSDIDKHLFPASWKTFHDVAAFYRSLPSHAVVFGADFQDGFEHLEVHPSVRARLVFHLPEEGINIRNAAPFGIRSIPGEFSTATEVTIDITVAYFGGRVRALNHMDDLTIAILDPSLDFMDVIKFIESLGWVFNAAKTTLPSRTPTHIGLEWNLDDLTVSLKEDKRIKYIGKVDAALEAFNADKAIMLRDVESLTGCLQYVAFVKRDLRPRLRVLYRFRASFTARYKPRHLRENEVRTLRWWKTFLSAGPVIASFADLPPSVDAIFASDASNEAIGIFYKAPHQPFPLVAAFKLLQDWRIKLDAYIGSAESWGVEALLDLIVRLDIRDATVTLLCDNMNIVDGWSRGWSQNALNNASFARMFDVADKAGLHLEIEYIATDLNPADEVSRCKLPAGARCLPEDLFPSPPPGCEGGPDPLLLSSYFPIPDVV
ncbi:hypothetical protein JCM10213_007474 [Rhodosporidiobolus nylandii]